jgi:uncharacterized protein (DUF427 family)
LNSIVIFGLYPKPLFKGLASYYTVEVNGETNNDAAWFYPKPKEAAKNIKNYVAFWRGVKIIKD